MEKRLLKNQMLKRFEGLASVYEPDNVKRTGWSSRSTQIARFSVLAKIGSLKGKSILDVGCGIGDFYKYLLERKFQGKYIGYDLVAANCSAASEKYGSGLFFQRDILDITDEQQFDYVLASGIFYLPADDWNDAVSITLKRMFELCKIGIAANFLSIYSPNKIPDLFYVHPATIINICSNFTNVFRIHHDYALKRNDFTLFAYREISSYVNSLISE